MKKPTHYGKDLPPERLHAFYIDYQDREDIRRAELGLCSPTPRSPSPCPGSPAHTILDTPPPDFKPNLDSRPLCDDGQSSLSTIKDSLGYTHNSTYNHVPTRMPSNPTVSDRVNNVAPVSIPAPSEPIHAAMCTLREGDMIPPLALPEGYSEDEEMLPPPGTPKSPLYRDVAPSPAYNLHPEPFTSFSPSSFPSNADFPHLSLEQAESPSLTQPPADDVPDPNPSREATPTAANPYATHPHIPAEQPEAEILPLTQPPADKVLEPSLLREATASPYPTELRLYRLPGHFRPRTHMEGCEIRDQLVQDAVDDDYRAEYHFGVAGQYRARANDNRRRAADLDRILSWY